jgi:hypothetical protein
MIIGISGKIGSGKDTLADVIMQYDHKWTKRGFADKLKRVCSIITNTSIQEQYDRSGKNTYLGGWGFTIGQMQQHIGVKMREIDPNFWVKALFADYTPFRHWIISDVRFRNEAIHIRNAGGFLVRIDGSRTGPQGRDPDHISEIDLDTWTDWDYRFDNTELDMGDLRGHATDILKKVYHV